MGDARGGAVGPGARTRVRADLEGDAEGRVLEDARERRGNASLAEGDPVEVVAELKRQPGKELAVGGAGLASTLIGAGLVDEYRQFVSPVVLGAGTPFFPPLDERIELELVETRTFGSRVVYLRHRARS